MAQASQELTAAQARVVAAALVLFGRHGVGGTSLQMIADEIGVTKAAVYRFSMPMYCSHRMFASVSQPRPKEPAGPRMLWPPDGVAPDAARMRQRSE